MWCRGEVHAACQLHVGERAILLQLGEDPQVDRVQVHVGGILCCSSAASDYFQQPLPAFPAYSGGMADQSLTRYLADPGGDTEMRTRLFVQSQGSAFYGSGSVWAPRYRQAAYGAFLLKSDDAEHALDLAYSDVASAFDRFLKEAGDGQAEGLPAVPPRGAIKPACWRWWLPRGSISCRPGDELPPLPPMELTTATTTAKMISPMSQLPRRRNRQRADARERLLVVHRPPVGAGVREPAPAAVAVQAGGGAVGAAIQRTPEPCWGNGHVRHRRSGTDRGGLAARCEINVCSGAANPLIRATLRPSSSLPRVRACPG